MLMTGWRRFRGALLSVPAAFLLLVLAVREYIARIELILQPHTVFSGITYTDAHVQLGGMMLICNCAGAGRDRGGDQFCGAAGSDAG